jgi:ABC-type dipeptide/oligopeptide/nickel transport system ATPase component
MSNPQRGRRRRPIVLEGDVPNRIDPLEPCRFHPRCPRLRPGQCDVEEPQLCGFGAEHGAARHSALERWPMSGEEIRRADEAVAAG